MVKSIIEDIRNNFSSGNMISRIILVNVGIYILINLIYVFDFKAATDPNSLYHSIENWFSLPSDVKILIRQPWSLLSHMFLHVGFWHLLWNMLMLYWFGRIVGDLIGDERILPIYILSGLFGGLVYIIHDLYLPGGTGGLAYAMGASAAVMALIWSAAMVSPDYNIHLLFLGPVKLKYIALALLFFDLVGSAGDINKGGHFAHMGGAAWGILFVYLLQRGTDITSSLSNFIKRITQQKTRKEKIKKTSRNKFKIVHKSNKTDDAKAPKAGFDKQEELDRILDKINAKGYEKLTPEEKDFLYNASKKK